MNSEFELDPERSRGVGEQPAILQFGPVEPAVEYTLRPGGYAIVFSGEGMVATVQSPRRLTLPGGGQDAGESPATAAIRETAEECGLVIAIEQLLGVADEMTYAPEEGRHFRKRCTFFLARVNPRKSPCSAVSRSKRARLSLGKSAMIWSKTSL